jgi:hypothetical protein
VTKPKPSRTRWRIAVAVVVLFAAVAWPVAFPAYKRHRAIQQIERMGGFIQRDIVGRQWLRQWGIEFEPVWMVDLKRTRITDDGLQHLTGLTSLQELYLENTRITDDGLKHLSDLTGLEILHLSGTHVSDDGLQHLSGLTSLRQLSLGGTHVSDDGVKMLQESLPECEIIAQ